MGVLLGPRLDPAAMVRRLQILLLVRDRNFASDVLDGIRTTEPTAVHEFDNFPGLNNQLQPVPPFPLCKVFTCRVGSTRLLFAGGVFNADKGAELWDGYTGANLVQQLFSETPGRNLALQRFADGISFFVGSPQCDAQIWCGHSAGGAACWYFAADEHLFGNGDAAPEILAFGSPRPVKNVEWHDNTWGSWIHVFNDDDPVPMIPPQVGYWEAVLAGLTGLQANRIQGFTVPAGGHELSFTGYLSERHTPSRLGTTPPNAIGQWLDRQNRGLGTPHNLEAYLAHALLLQLNSGTAAESPNATGTSVGDYYGGYDAPEVPPVTPARVRQVQSEAQESIIRTTERNVTESMVVIPAAQAFKAVRNGRIWYVTFRGTPITLAPNKKRALGFARVGNDFLRRMQIEGIVDTVALVSVLKSYCEDASDPNGAFMPVLNALPQ